VVALGIVQMNLVEGFDDCVEHACCVPGGRHVRTFHVDRARVNRGALIPATSLTGMAGPGTDGLMRVGVSSSCRPKVIE
jgi:hypothetical protein